MATTKSMSFKGGAIAGDPTPTPVPADALFIVRYDETPASDIGDALHDKKVPCLFYNGEVVELAHASANNYVFRTTHLRNVGGENILYIVDYQVIGSAWTTSSREISNSGSSQAYIDNVASTIPLDTTGLTGMNEVVSITTVPEDGVYQVSIMMNIKPKSASPTKSNLVFKFTGAGDVGMPNRTFYAIMDDSQVFEQQVMFSTTLNLKAGTNKLYMSCGGLATEYLVFVDDLTVAQLVNGIYNNGDDFEDVHTLPEIPDFNNDDGVLVDGATGGPRFMLWQTLANKVLGFIKSLSTTITAFRTGDVIPVDGPNGTAKMSKDDLLKETVENSRSLDRAFVYSELPAENFGVWESGSFSSTLENLPINTRARTHSTFLASKELFFTFHIPNGYKLYINWTTATADDMVWRTGTTRVHIPAGDYYRIAIAKTDDSNIQSVAATIYATSGIFVDEDFYSVNKTEERIIGKTAQKADLNKYSLIYSELPAENFGVWESGSFTSSFVDWANSARARTKETFLAEKELTFTFHIPDGYKIYINWTTSTADDRVWRTGTPTVTIPSGDYYRISYAKTDDSDITSIASRIYVESGAYVDEGFYSSQEIRKDIEKNTASRGLMGTNYKWTSRHFVCVSDGFKIEDRLNRAYIIKKASGTARCKVAILGKPSNDYKMSFKVGNPIGTGADAMHEIHFTDENNVHHKLLNQDGNGYYSTTWYLDGTDTGGCWFLPIEFSFDGSNFKVVVDNGVPQTIYTSNVNAKDIHFETYMGKDKEVFLEDYKQEGYALKIPTSSMPFPFTEGVDVHGTTLYCGYWNASNKLEIYTRDLLTGEEHTKTFDSIVLTQDSHNYVALGVDTNGGIHVGCNCHYSPLVYLYGDDLDSVAVSSKLSESYATYPSFFKFGGNFYATYRELTSSSGRWKVYLYDAVAKTFSATTNEYIARGDNSSPTACPYLQKWVVDEDGGWCYNSFVWRDSGDNSTNHDFFAFKTQDFQTFYNLNDEVLTLPIDLSNCQQCQLDTIPTNSHLLNQQTNVIVIDGVVIALNFHDDDEGNTNLFAYKYKEGSIIKKCVSRFFGVGLYPVFAQANVCSGCVKIIVYTNHGSDRQDGSRTANIYLDKDLNWWTDKDVDDGVKSAAGKIRYPYNGKVKAINENYCFPGCFSESNCGFVILE